MVFKRIIHLKTTQDGPQKQKGTCYHHVFRAIRRRTGRLHSAEERSKIVLAGLRGEEAIAARCLKYGIHQDTYLKWSKEFMGAVNGYNLITTCFSVWSV